jgi:hypothetical protein
MREVWLDYLFLGAAGMGLVNEVLLGFFFLFFLFYSGFFPVGTRRPVGKRVVLGFQAGYEGGYQMRLTGRRSEEMLVEDVEVEVRRGELKKLKKGKRRRKRRAKRVWDVLS